MHEILNSDPLKNDNSDWINHTEWAKEYLFKYYNRLDNMEGKKLNNNRNKEFRYRKSKEGEQNPYQNKPWKINDGQPLLMDIIEEEENENLDLFNERKITVKTKRVSKSPNINLNINPIFNPFNPNNNNNNNNNNDIIDKERNENNNNNNI
jgi:hypothetical protein